MNPPTAFLEAINMLKDFAVKEGYELLGTLILTKDNSEAYIEQIDSRKL